MAQVLIIAYTAFVHDGRVKRHAEALAARGDAGDVISLRSGHDGLRNGVNVIGIPIDRYRGASRAGYLKSYLRFFTEAARLGFRMGRVKPYDMVITSTLPPIPPSSARCRRAGWEACDSRRPRHHAELYQEKFGGRRGAIGARMLMFLERWCAGFADRVFAVIRCTACAWERAGDVGTQNHGGDEFAAAERLQADGARRGSTGKCVLVCHRTITQRLGIDTAIKAVSLLADHIRGLDLRVIGGGDYLEQARTLALRCRYTYG